MKKVAPLLIAGLFLMSGNAVLADEYMPDIPGYEINDPKRGLDSKTKLKDLPTNPGEELMDISGSQVVGKVDELHRRLDYIEKQNRLQEEQIRRLDRTLNDLKRRR